MTTDQKVRGSSPLRGIMKLSETKIRQNVILTSIDLPEDKQIQLAEIGITSGCNACPIMKLAKSLLVNIDGCCLVLDDEITSHIEVE